jgi:hypothetical protein
MEQAGAVQLLGRVGTQASFSPANINDYYLQWPVPAPGRSCATPSAARSPRSRAGRSPHPALTFNGGSISAAINGTTVGTVTDGAFGQGMVGLGVDGYQTDQFDNLSVPPVSGAAGPVTGPIVAGDDSAECVDDNGDSSTEGTHVQMWDCNGGPAQNWTIATNGTIQINGGCMDITGAGTSNGTLVEEWDCNGGANQQWEAVGGTLANPVSGKCLDDTAFNTTEGTQLEIWTCNDGSNQQWVLP